LVSCQPPLLNQVFLNLLLNAASAIPVHGTITLTTHREGDWVSISFSDTGCGIAPEHREKIFDPFFTTQPVGQGVGVGLSVAHSIIDQHGGVIEVFSQPGLGATFMVRLPVSRDTGQA
jgi:signal transduction histidine kinase